MKTSISSVSTPKIFPPFNIFNSSLTSFKIVIAIFFLSLFTINASAQIANEISSLQECIDYSLIDTTAVVPAIYDPVCGCNGRTYPNKYIARLRHGVTEWRPGACGNCQLDLAISEFTYTCMGAIACVDIIGGASPYRIYLRAQNNAFQEVTNNSACFDELRAGNYELIVKDREGCEANVYFTVPQTNRILDAEIQPVSCFGGEDGVIDLIVPIDIPLRFEWRGPNGFTANTEDIDQLVAGEYQVKVSLLDGTCYTSAIFIVEQPRDLKLEFNRIGNACGEQAAGCLLVYGGTAPYKPWVFYSPNPVSTPPVPVFNPNGVPEVDGLQSTTEFEFDGNNSSEEYCARDIPAGIYYVLVVDAHRCWEFIRIEISMTSGLEVDGRVKEVTCFGGEDGSIDLQIEGGRAPYTSFWTNEEGESSEDFNNLKAGKYLVTVYDANQCTATIRLEINEPDELNAEFIITSERCDTGVDGCLIIRGGTAPYKLWAFRLPSPNTPLPTPVFTTEGDVILEGMPAVNDWSFDASTTSIDERCARNIPAGTYYVLIVDAHRCWEFIKVVIPDVSGLELDGRVKEVTCFGGEDGSIDLQIEGGRAPYTSFWTNEEGKVSEDFNNLKAGKYLITVYDANQCTATIRLEINEPLELMAEFEITNQNCERGTDGCLFINGGTAPYQLWVFTSPDPQPALSAPVFTPNGVPEVDGLTRTEEVDFETTILPMDRICARDIPAGIYYVLIADANQCWIFKRIKVEAFEGLELYFDYDGLGEFACVDPTNGTAPYDIVWTNLDNGNEVTSDERFCIYDLRPGAYWVEVIDANGCSATELFFVEARDCAGGEAIVDPGEIRSGQSTHFALINYKGARIQWQFKTEQTDWLDIPGANSERYATPAIHAIKDKLIAVRALVQCEDGTTVLSTSARLIVHGNPNLDAGMIAQDRHLFNDASVVMNRPALRMDNELADVYPTISAGNVQLRLNADTEQTRIRIVDLNGQTHREYSSAAYGKGETEELDLSGLPSGVYLVKIETPDSYCTQRVIIQHK